jgi:sialidase-1
MKLPLLNNSVACDKGKYVDINKATRPKGFSVTNKRKLFVQKETRDGFVDVPLLEAVDARSSFILFLEGNAIGIAIVSGPNAGIIEYRIDNGKATSGNLFTQ